MVNANGKVELYRQGQFRKKSESQFLPSLGGNKIGPKGSFMGTGTNNGPKRKTGSAMGHSRMTPNERWNDIPDNESHMQGGPVGPKPGSNYGYAQGNRGISQKEITDKPSNLMFSQKDEKMVFRERKLNKLDRQITDKLTNARAGIDYNHYG